MEKAKMTPKDFFLWAGAIVSFYWSIASFIFLVFEYINYALPNSLSYYPADPYQSGIPYEMASLIVLFPIYLCIMWVIRRDVARDNSRNDIWVRRWALIFTLFIAGLTVAVDLILLLTTFLRGEEITLAFILKVLVVLLVAVVTFMHFIADFWGYWNTYPSRQRTVSVGVGVLALLTVVAGFFIVGTPQSARLYRFDEQKITDLQSIQYQIVNYYQLKQRLPANLSELADPVSYFKLPSDPQTGKPYEYSVTDGSGSDTPLFGLCANFNKETRTTRTLGPNEAVDYIYPDTSGIKGNISWQHGAGRVCFTRTIDPERYPPANSKIPSPPTR